MHTHSFSGGSQVSGEPRDPNLIWKDVIHPIFKLLLGLKETVKQQVIIKKQPLMIFVLMHWGEKETHLIPPRNQILRQTVWRLMFTLFWLPERQVTSGAKVEAAAHCDQSVQMFLWPWIVHARWAKCRPDWLFCQGENLDLNVKAVY